MSDLAALVVSALTCFGFLALGGAVTRPALQPWYRALQKPWFNPPNIAFPIAWSLLFTAMAVSAWLVWRAGPDPLLPLALGLFGTQLVLNFLWSFLFFGLRSPGAALVEVVPFWASIVATTVVFHRIDPIAGWILVPYVLWVSFAIVLNFAIWKLNREGSLEGHGSPERT